MPKIAPVQVLRRKIISTLVLLLSCGLTLAAQPATQRGASEQRTASYFESIRKSPPKQLAFLLKMPKGGDLHNHLSGAVYAERYIEWAAEQGLSINTRTMAPRKFVSVVQCARDVEDMKLTSNSCRQFLAGNEKANLQWQLEQDFNVFEREWR
jgi:hypothetical protein